MNPQAKVVEKFFNFSLLGMLGSGYFALLGSGFLDQPTAVLAFAALFLRGLLAAGLITFTIPVRLATASALLYLGFFPLDFFYFSGSFLTATVHLVFFLSAVKILTAKTARDFAIVKGIAAMELVTAAWLSTGVNFFAFLALFVLFTIATFASEEVLRSSHAVLAAGPSHRAVARIGMRAFPRRLGAVSCALFSGILLLTAGMFFVLPRTARAAIERFAPARYHLPGFSNQLTLGEIGEIKSRSTPVMHVKLAYPGGGLLGVHWRGSALTQFDGKRWFNWRSREEVLRVEQGTVNLDPQKRSQNGRGVSYQVQLNEVASDTLFFAGTPEIVGVDVPTLFRTPEGAILAPRVRSGALRYFASSYLEDDAAEIRPAPEPLSESARRELLRLPPLDERIRRLALDMTAGAVTPKEKARALETRLRHDYGYTLELLPAAVPDPLAQFLLVRKKGHCEYFASAMAVMLRTLGIPSRVAIGFLSGTYNSMTGWQVVRASDAHSWVEAWLPGRGWTTFDPTPSDPSAASSGFLSRVPLFLDAADQFWQDWVLGYTSDSQLILASRMRESGREMRFGFLDHLIDDTGGWLQSAARGGQVYVVELVIALVLSGVALLYGPAAVRWWRANRRLRRAQRGDAHASDATLLYQRMLHTLERRGFQKPPWLTPAEFARVLPQSELAILVEDLTLAYNQVRFGGQPGAAPRMVRLLQRLETLQR